MNTEPNCPSTEESTPASAPVDTTDKVAPLNNGNSVPKNLREEEALRIITWSNKQATYAAPFHFYVTHVTVEDAWSHCLAMYSIEDHARTMYDPEDSYSANTGQQKMEACIIGRDIENRSVVARVVDFELPILLQFLTADAWHNRDNIMNHVCRNVLYSKKPLRWEEKQYMRNDEWEADAQGNTKQYNVIKLYLQTTRQFAIMKSFQEKQEKARHDPTIVLSEERNGIYSEEQSQFVKQILVSETDVTFYHKFLTEVKQNFSQWITIAELQPVASRYTTADIEFTCVMQSIQDCLGISKETIPNFPVVVFDIEQNSFHKTEWNPFLQTYDRQFCDKNAVEDVIINLSTNAHHLNKEDYVSMIHYCKSPFVESKRYVFDPNLQDQIIPIEKKQVVSFEYENEWDCINQWAVHMSEHIDYQFITHWNGNGFDWKHLIARVRLLSDPAAYVLSYFRFMDKVIHGKSRLKKRVDHMRIIQKQVTARFRLCNLSRYETLLDSKSDLPYEQEKIEKKRHEALQEMMMPPSLFEHQKITAELRSYKKKLNATWTDQQLDAWVARVAKKYVTWFDSNYQRALTLRDPKKSKLFAMSRFVGKPSVYIKKLFHSEAKGELALKYLQVPGRTNFDCMLEVMSRRSYPRYRLEDVAQHMLGIGKVDLAVHMIGDLYMKGQYDRLFAYALGDCELPVIISYRLQIIQDILALSGVCFTSYDDIINGGMQIEVFNLFVRYGHDQGWMMTQNRTPKTGAASDDSYEGANVLEAKTGFYQTPITVADFASLYPSVMIEHNLCSTTLVKNPVHLQHPNVKYRSMKISEKTTHYFVSHQDSLCSSLQRYLKAQRKAVQKEMEKHDKSSNEYKVLNLRQLAIKKLANSIYGYFGATFGRRPCKPVAESVCLGGRSALMTAMEGANEYAANVNVETEIIYGDTDSIMVQMKGLTGSWRDIVIGIQFGQLMSAFVSDKFGDAIELQHENVYHPYAIYQKKRYMGVKFTAKDFEVTLHDGTVIKVTDMMGIALGDFADATLIGNPEIVKKGVDSVRRGGARVSRNLFDECADRLLQSRKDEIKPLLLQRIDDIAFDRVKVEDYAQSAKLKKDYKQRPAHAIVRDNMRLRNPGTEPGVGERIYIVPIVGTKRTKSENYMDLQYMIDHPGEYKVDRANFLATMKNTFRQLLEPVHQNTDDWFDAGIKIAENSLTKQRSLTHNNHTVQSIVNHKEERVTVTQAPQEGKQLTLKRTLAEPVKKAKTQNKKKKKGSGQRTLFQRQ